MKRDELLNQAKAESSSNTEDIRQLGVLFLESIEVKQRVMQEHLKIIGQMGRIIFHALKSGGKLLICGNGGSAADAQHLAAELLIRLRPHNNRESIPAIAITGDLSAITACGNDYGFETYFARMIEGLGKPGDVLLGISTSGKSPNVIQAFKMARKKDIVALGFLGGDGGPALKECDLAFVVPSKTTGRIQESHITAGHAMLELIEDLLLQNKCISPIRASQ
jgi:D-sedoheptulose 7-phosphate isomerase